jgi:serine/threonine-protein kinase
MNEVTLPGFELIERLGVGGMGVVWKARQISLDRMVAIKVIRPEAIRSTDDLKQILNEARVAARLKHSGIVQVYDACEQNGTYFLVMEFIDGYTIGSWMSRRKHLASKDVLLIAESVAGALDYAWKTSGLIHRDIKPENVMVDQDGTIKVADLGVSLTKESVRSDHESEITGTPGYMSPEQVRGGLTLDCRTDIYSLGAMMYELLTGRRPFNEKSDAEAMECQLTSTIVDPRDIVPDIPLNVCLLLERMMVKNRDGRLADWSKVLVDIRRVMKGASPLGIPPDEGSSTISVRRKRIGAVKQVSPAFSVSSKNNSGKVMKLFLVLLVLGNVLALVWHYRFQLGEKLKFAIDEIRRAKTVPVVEQAALSDDDATDSAEWAKAALQRVETAKKWRQLHPNDEEESIKQFQYVITAFSNTPAASMAQEEIYQIHIDRQEAQRSAISAIEQKVDELVQSKDFEGALAYLEKYDGPFVSNTESNRQFLAKGVRDQLETQNKTKADQVAWVELSEQIAGKVFAGKLQLALKDVEGARKSGRFPQRGDELANLAQVLNEALQAPANVKDSFRADIGKVVTVRLGRGEMRLKIAGISGQKVMAVLVNADTPFAFDPEDLAVDERFKRLGDPEKPGIALAKGLLAVNVNSFQVAEELFPKTGPFLSELLMARLQVVKALKDDVALIGCLARVLKAGGVVVGPYDEKEWIRTLEQESLTSIQVAALNEQREKFLAKYGMTEFAVKAAPVLLALERRCVTTLEANATASPGSQ